MKLPVFRQTRPALDASPDQPGTLCEQFMVLIDFLGKLMTSGATR